MSDSISNFVPEDAPALPRECVPRVRYGLPLVMLLSTFCTTVLVGSRLQFNFNHHLEAFASGNELLPLFPVQWLWQSPRQLLLGIPFSLAIMGILLAHEMGHYYFCQRYRVRATLPFFIPAPTLIGTLGAFIRIGGFIRSRKALFDIGIAGPIAGFVVAVPTMLAGLAMSYPVASVSDPDLQFGFPLIFQIGHAFLHPGGPPLAHYYLHPVALAGWAGMLATAMVPRPCTRSWCSLRWNMTWTASARLIAPETSAAATSPTLWPSTISGLRPQAARLADKADCTAKRRG